MSGFHTRFLGPWLVGGAIGCLTLPSAFAQTPATAAPQVPAPKADAPAVGFEPARDAAEEASKSRARKLYERGAQAYAEGKFYQAADLFLETYRVYPSTQLLFNVARALDKVGNVSGALRYYRDYVRQSPASSDEAEVSTRVRELEALLEQRGVQQLTVLSDPEGAKVVLDGQPLGLTPFTSNTHPGKHHLVLSLEGHLRSEDVVEVDAHRSQQVLYKLSPTPAAPASSGKDATRRDEPASVSGLSWGVLGTGVALLGAALVVEMANQETRGISKTSAFLAGGGIAATAVSGVLLYLDLNPSRPPMPSPTPNAARPSGRRVGLGLALRF